MAHAGYRVWTARRALLTAGTVTAGAAYYSRREQLPLQAESIPDKSDQPASVPILWTPPERADMIAALKRSRSLPRVQSDLTTARFEGVAAPSLDSSEDEYDLLIIGGGATGAGAAVDAASRGLKVAMVDRDDWASGTSSKSTKLVHGGVRYLQKAIMELDYEQWKLVKEALHERKTFLHIAPHLSAHLPIMLPVYTWWKLPYYWAGTKMYDILAGGENMESSYFMSKGKSLEQFPMLKPEGLVGSLVYYDGQHNDSRMNIALVMTAIHHGAVAANHIEVTELLKKPDPQNPGKQRVCGAAMRDVITGQEWTVKAKGVINATGPFTDGIRKMDDAKAEDIVAPSSGVHITLPTYYSPGKMGMLDPATSDGRVIFFLPWQGNAIAGTTDTPSEVEQHPIPKEEEIQWILGEVRNYLNGDIKVRRGDVLSAWSGVRPLVRNPKAKKSEGLVRNHMINISDSGLLTIAGGKWTTYRAMAQETVDAAIKEYNLKPTGPCVTEQLRLIGAHGWHKNLYVSLIQQFGLDDDVAKHLSENYGSLAWVVCSMAAPTGYRWPVHGKRLDPAYPFIEAEVKYGCRREMATTATDVISRRTRLAFLNAQAALEVLPRVIDIMAQELGWDKKRCLSEFSKAKDYLRSMGLSEDLQTLSMDDVRKGMSRKLSLGEQQNARAIFSPEELSALTETFTQMDRDKDGKISAADLTYAMKRVGYADVGKEKVASIIKGIDTDLDGRVEFPEFLNAVSGYKALQLSSAFTQVVSDLQKAEMHGPGKDAGQINRQGRIPVERSGGGT